MRILWLTNFIPPVFGDKLGIDSNNKEGWISGILSELMANCPRDMKLYIAVPTPVLFPEGYIGDFDGVSLYGYRELSSEIYSENLEKDFSKILELLNPDVIHIFGTEYPHTRAMLEAVNKDGEKLGISTDRVLIGMQGVCGEIWKHYLDGVPRYIARKNSFRDILKKDGLKKQVKKFETRAKNERRALSLTGNVTGRTAFDKAYIDKWAKDATYYSMNESLRPEFYGKKWECDKCEPHTIFASQGNYPVKGLHYLIPAFEKLLANYPDARLVVAGDNITKHKSIKDKLKLQAYAKYLLKLEKEVAEATGKPFKVDYVGSLKTADMLETYMKASVFVCPSTVENSPNSLGEAMLMGMPVVAAKVGGIPSMVKDREEGLLYEAGNIDQMVKCISDIWDDAILRNTICTGAARRAAATHDRETNYLRLMEIYKSISER